MNDMCRKCSNLQEYEPAAGLNEGCKLMKSIKMKIAKSSTLKIMKLCFHTGLVKVKYARIFQGLMLL